LRALSSANHSLTLASSSTSHHLGSRNLVFTTKLRGSSGALEGGDGKGNDDISVDIGGGSVPPPVVANTEAGWVIQSSVQGSNPLWDRGLSGEGQTVGVIDTGLDECSCYFEHEESTIVTTVTHPEH
jgi:hypothetical protein